MTEAWIDVRGLVKRFAGKSILDGVDLEVQAGETVMLLGPSGGGKSTLLRCINGLNDWDAGEVRVGPLRLKAGRRGRTGERAARLMRLLAGMIFQDFQLFPHLSAIENVMVAPRTVLKLSYAAAAERARTLLARVGLADRADHYPDQLSGGQKQRVAIARAVAMQPEGLLCDEITSALDPAIKHEVLDVLEDLKRDGLTLVMVTHELGFARHAADRIVVLAGGRIVEQGTPQQVLDEPRHELTRQFLSRTLE